MSAEALSQEETLREFHALASGTLEDLAAQTTRAAQALGEDREAWEQFYAIVALHRCWQARLEGLRCAARRVVIDEGARQLVCWLIHDEHDLIAMLAASMAVEHGIGAAVPELFSALGNSRAALAGIVYARTDLRADFMAVSLREILAKEADRAVIEAKLLTAGYNPAQDASKRPLNTAGMVRVPAETSDYFIDPHPVRVEDYERFLAAVEEVGHVWCHRGEPAGYDHGPSYLNSPASLESGRIVTGVSWFDAFAFTAWSGKALPTTAQWQRALTGDARSAEFSDQVRARLVTVDGTFADLNARLDAMLNGRAAAPVVFDESERGLPAPRAQPSGLWEWTRSRHLDGHDLSPFIGRSHYHETVADWTLYATVRGGLVGSSGPPAPLSYEGRKHVLHKSPEVTFRGVLVPLGP